jgi:hypothetical protein
MTKSTSTDKPTWIRWHQLPRGLAAAIVAEGSTVYLALHPHHDKLAILAVPSAERIHLSPAATARVATRTVLMTIVHSPPTCPARLTRGHTRPPIAPSQR